MRQFFTNAIDSLNSLNEQKITYQKRKAQLKESVLESKIILERAKTLQAEELKSLSEIKEEVNQSFKDLELTDQRAVVAKFELHEVKEAFDDLNTTIRKIQLDRDAEIEPILSALNEEVAFFEL